MLPDRRTPATLVLSLQCRARGCESDAVQLLVRSSTIVTLQCLTCRHTWSDELIALPDDARMQIALATEHPPTR